MTEADRPPTPGERRLDRPPSDRYRVAPPGQPGGTSGAPGSSGTLGALGAAAVAGLGGVAATVGLGGILGQTAGLLAVAAATGWAIGTTIRLRAGRSMARSARIQLAVAVGIATVLVGQVGLWLYARTEGGVLALPDHLWQTYGILVPVQAAFVMGLAWWTAR